MKQLDLLALCNNQEQDRLKELLHNRYDTNLIIYNESEQNQFINYLNNNNVDLILIENSIKNKLNILNKYQNKEKYNKTIVVDDYNLLCYKYLDNYLFNIFQSGYNKDLLYICLDTIRKLNHYYNIPLYQKINIILDKTNLPNNKLGYIYIKKAIYEAFNNPLLLKNFKKHLYPLLSKKYHKSICSIERAMRYSIYKAMDNTNDEYNNKLFSKYMTYDKTIPTTQEFILTIVNNLLSEYGKIS